MKLVTSVIVLLCHQAFAQRKIDPKELKCLVCETTIEEVDKVVRKLNPNILVETGGYRIDGEGNIKQHKVPQTRSEIHLSEILDKVCEKMDDYVRATWKSNGKLTLLKLVDDDGKMTSDMSLVDIIQDSDLNKSLKFYCEGIVEEFEEAIIQSYVNQEDDIDIKICSSQARFCLKSVPTGDYVNDEL